MIEPCAHWFFQYSVDEVEAGMSGDIGSLLRPFLFVFCSQIGVLPTLALFTRFVFDLGQGCVVGRPVKSIMSHAVAFVMLLAVPCIDTHPTVAKPHLRLLNPLSD